MGAKSGVNNETKQVWRRVQSCSLLHCAILFHDMTATSLKTNWEQNTSSARPYMILVLSSQFLCNYLNHLYIPLGCQGRGKG